jgi:hypothetical protein
MARNLVVLEISMVSCTLVKTLSASKKSSAHLVQSCLVWPRAGIATRFSASRLDLLGGGCDLSDASWSRRIVFKESVEATFGLKVDVTEALGSDALEEFLRFMAGTLLSLGADVVDDLVVPGKLAAAPLDYFAAKIKKVPEPQVIASGAVDLSVDDIPGNEEGKLVRLELKSPREIVQRSRRTVNKKTKLIRKVLLAEDEINGEILLQLRRI